MPIILADIISRVESDDNPFAIRFEISSFARRDEMPRNIINSIVDIHKCSQLTAAVLYATSWGRFQIMGFNLWGGVLGYEKTFVEYLTSPQDQFDAFNRFTLVPRKTYQNAGWNGSEFTDQSMLQGFSRWYNGPGAVSQYMGRMEKAASDLLAAQSKA